jgi:hypothetical protein
MAQPVTSRNGPRHHVSSRTGCSLPKGHQEGFLKITLQNQFPTLRVLCVFVVNFLFLPSFFELGGAGLGATQGVRFAHPCQKT